MAGRRGPISVGTNNGEPEKVVQAVKEAAAEQETKAQAKKAQSLLDTLPPVEEKKAEVKPAPAPKPQRINNPPIEPPKLVTEEPKEEEKKEGFLPALKNGIITENPTLRLVLGTCPTLAVTTSVSSAIGMGLAATVVLICSNAVISALRKVIPDKVRIPAFITIIAGFVTIVQMFVKAFAPALDKSLGIYLPLIVVNCIILGRAEMFASKNKVLPSMVDGLAMGIGFTCALFCMSTIREVLGNGSFLGLSIPVLSNNPILIFLLPAGGFFVFGMLIALSNKLSRKKGLPIKNNPCGSCPAAATCSKRAEGGCEK